MPVTPVLYSSLLDGEGFYISGYPCQPQSPQKIVMRRRPRSCDPETSEIIYDIIFTFSCDCGEPHQPLVADDGFVVGFSLTDPDTP